jgi:hypothetical protein
VCVEAVAGVCVQPEARSKFCFTEGGRTRHVSLRLLRPFVYSIFEAGTFKIWFLKRPSPPSAWATDDTQGRR